MDACQNSKKKPGKDRGAPDFPRSEKDRGGSFNQMMRPLGSARLMLDRHALQLVAPL
jgi:hypothetical protein